MKRVRIDLGNDSHDYLIDPEHLFNVAMARNSCCAHARAMLGVLMFDILLGLVLAVVLSLVQLT